MKIAICDDEPQYIEAFSAMLAAYTERSGAELRLNAFSDADSLLRALAGGAQFGVIFLDVLMPYMGGIEAARELRKLDGGTDLVFLTTSPDFALDAFSVKARDYLVKPLTEATLFRLMDDLTARLDEEETILIDSKKGIRKLLPDRIEYCEALNHKFFWHLRSGVVLESGDSIQAVERLLSRSGLFLRVHRAFLVNRHCIASFDWGSCTVELESMTRIPIPKAKFSAVRQQYLEAMKGGKPT